MNTLSLLFTPYKVKGLSFDSFFLPEYLKAEKSEGYMAHFAEIIKKSVSKTPIIAAGRIQSSVL